MRCFLSVRKDKCGWYVLDRQTTPRLSRTIQTIQDFPDYPSGLGGCENRSKAFYMVLLAQTDGQAAFQICSKSKVPSFQMKIWNEGPAPPPRFQTILNGPKHMTYDLTPPIVP